MRRSRDSKRSYRSKRSFVHVIARASRASRASRSPARVVMHVIHLISFTRGMHSTRGRARGGDRHTHDDESRLIIPLFVSFSSPNGQKKNQKIEKHTRRACGGVHTSHDPIERERIARAGRAKMPSRSIARERDTQKHALDDGSCVVNPDPPRSPHPDPRGRRPGRRVPTHHTTSPHSSNPQTTSHDSSHHAHPSSSVRPRVCLFRRHRAS